MYKMNILMSFDDNYLEPALVCLNSLFRNNRNCVIWFLYHKASDDCVSRLHDFCTRNGQEFKPCKVDNSDFGGLKTRLYYTVEMYYRLFCPDYLSETVDKVLYLDPDIAVNGSLLPLFEKQSDDNCIFSACPDFHAGAQKSRLALPDPYSYVCSGVILIDLQKYRRIYNKELILQYCTEHSEELLYPDQDVLNALYYPHISYLDGSVYNYMVNEVRNREISQASLKNAVIIHFASQPKPWNDNFDRKKCVRDLYESYVAPDFCPTISDVLQKNKNRFYLLRLRRMILDAVKVVVRLVVPKKVFIKLYFR